MKVSCIWRKILQNESTWSIRHISLNTATTIRCTDYRPGLCSAEEKTLSSVTRLLAPETKLPNLRYFCLVKNMALSSDPSTKHKSLTVSVGDVKEFGARNFCIG